MYSIDIAGYIPKQKWKEFKQHMKQILSQQYEENIKFSVSQDIVNKDSFQVKMSFPDKESMISFINSEYYATITGSFRVLGMLSDKTIREQSDMNYKDQDDES